MQILEHNVLSERTPDTSNEPTTNTVSPKAASEPVTVNVKKMDDAAIEARLKSSIDDMDWDIDDLLKIICGSIIPDGRIIIATCNDLQIIYDYCPQLVRPGRMTPVKYDYGTPEMFIKIVKDYTDLDCNTSMLPENYVFSQAGLIEYLLTSSSIAPILIDDILAHLEEFIPYSFKQFKQFKQSKPNAGVLPNDEFDDITQCT
jgi:hypothetical protein